MRFRIYEGSVIAVALDVFFISLRHVIAAVLATAVGAMMIVAAFYFGVHQFHADGEISF